MLASNIPSKSAKVFGTSATGTYIRAVPQTTGDPAAASFDLGFPPQTFTDEGAGGTPPDGRDFNGILNHLSGWCRWLMAGGPVAYDSAFQTAIGGYPAGAIVASAVTAGVRFRSTTDNNVTNPDAGGAGWIKDFDFGTTSGVSWRTWPAGNGKQAIRMAANASFSSESQQTIAFPGALVGAGLSAVTDWGVSTVLPFYGNHYDQMAQVVGTPSGTQIIIAMQQFGGGDYTWPIQARWWVEGVLP